MILLIHSLLNYLIPSQPNQINLMNSGTSHESQEWPGNMHSWDINLWEILVNKE